MIRSGRHGIRRGRALLASLALAGALAGCFSSKPPHNVGFTPAHALNEFDGLYENRSEGKPDRAIALSEVIWPREPKDTHARIGLIHVRAAGEGITVRGLALLDSSIVVKEQTFVNGADFDFRSGRIRLHRGMKSNIGETGDQAGIFVINETVELGIDKAGQGKYKSTETSGGVAYLVMPIVARETTELRFVKVKH